jgi:hypothetical protein
LLWLTKRVAKSSEIFMVSMGFFIQISANSCPPLYDINHSKKLIQQGCYYLV